MSSGSVDPHGADNTEERHEDGVIKDAVDGRPGEQGTPAAENAGEGVMGKDKAPEVPPSLADRLQTSGRMALRALHTTPLFGSNSNSGSASKSANPASALATADNVAAEASTYRPHPGSAAGESLRTHSHISEGRHAYDEFTEQPHTLPGPEEVRSSAAGLGGPMAAPEPDGYAVLRLLDQPDFLQDQDDIFAEEQDELSPDEARRLQDALFGSPSRNPSWDSLLNFTPGFVAGGDSAQDAAVAGLLTGTLDLEEARQTWLMHWGEVLSSYTDYVWGDLGPLAAQAKKEVDDLTASPPDAAAAEEPKGLRRLRQILGHVRGSTSGP